MLVCVPDVLSKRLIHNGVATMPISELSVALKTATGTLPRAAEVMATDDETVTTGRRDKRNPVAGPG